MNKRMRELLNKMRELQAKADGFLANGSTEELNKVLTEIENVKNTYNSEKAIFEAEKAGIPDNNGEPKENKADGFAVMAKVLRHTPLTEAENALITGGTNGENYLVPEDVDLTIHEARNNYNALKKLVTVVPTTMLSGTEVFAADDTENLEDFTEGTDLTSATNPTFTKKSWAISFFGKTFPISNILLGAEKAGLMAYINRWFTGKAIRTENEKIIAELKKNKTAVQIKGVDELKKQINTGVKSEYLVDGVILTNQTGFNMIDSETDAVGRPVLQLNYQNPTQYLFKGLPIYVVSDATLPNVSGKAPVFIGSLKAGIVFHDYAELQFATSEHVYFNKNQTALRVIEGFSVMQELSEAYIYGLLSAADGKTVKTETKTVSGG